MASTVVHCDTTVILERPRLGTYRDDMRSSIASGLRVPFDAVNVKATTGEGIGFIGRAEGCAALAGSSPSSAARGRSVGGADVAVCVTRVRSPPPAAPPPASRSCS